jgi:hypothetical protein
MKYWAVLWFWMNTLLTKFGILCLVMKKLGCFGVFIVGFDRTFGVTSSWEMREHGSSGKRWMLEKITLFIWDLIHDRRWRMVNTEKRRMWGR